MIYSVAASLAFVLFVLAYIRLAPSALSAFHVDPRRVSPGTGRYVVAPEGGDRGFGPVPRLPGAVLSAFDGIACATPRTRRLFGSPTEGRITYVTRSRLFGFPDYTTVEVIETGAGTSLAIFARLRFGRRDSGVNRQRIDDWLGRLERRLERDSELVVLDEQRPLAAE